MVQLTVGNSILFCTGDISLEATVSEDLLGRVEHKLPKIKASCSQLLRFENVSEPLHRCTELLLNW